MTSEVSGGSWYARYPDLAGKVAIVSGVSSHLAEMAAALCSSGVAVATVAPDRATADATTAAAERYDVAALGVVADPADPATWERITPHVEQRLGPIDITVVAAPGDMRAVVIAVLLPDMAARGRGVVVEVGVDVAAVTPPRGVRHRAVSGGPATIAADLAAAMLWCASDTVTAPTISIRIG